MDWIRQLLYLGALAAILLVGAGLLYLLCYCIRKYTTGDDVDDDTVEPNENNNGQQAARNKSALKGGGGGQQEGGATTRNDRETRMCSSLQASGEDNDVILATAMSSIPLKQLGGKKNEIVIDVAQQLYVNEDWLDQCVVCKNRNKVTCFAQTTIKVLVFRPLLSSPSPPPSSSPKTPSRYPSPPITPPIS